MAWDDDKKQEAVKLYLAKEPTPENSMEIVKEVAEELDESPNGVRIILSKAEVYVKKTPAATEVKASTGTTRVSKAASEEALIKAIEDAGQTADTDITSKLTGKASQYFTALIQAINT
jgi:hypothetical protein